MKFLLALPVLLFSIVVHEVAHAWVARREGDDTADKLGRITLNPLPHLDTIGSLIVPMLLYASNTGFIFGWAKPVPVNPSKFRDPLWGDIRVSLAGIVSNLILLVVFALLTVVFYKLEAMLQQPWIGALAEAAVFGILINAVLALFNLLPIPPLDGSHVVAHILPEALVEPYRALGRYGLLILMGLFFLAPGVMDQLVFAPMNWIMETILGLVMVWV